MNLFSKKISVRLFTRSAMIALCAVLMLNSTAALRATAAPQAASPDATNMDATFVSDWIQLTHDRIQSKTVSAPAASRAYAYTSVTLYEAVVPGLAGYASLSSQLTSMPTMPAPDISAVYDWPTVANAAVSTVINGLIADADTHTAVAALHDKQLADRAKAVSTDVTDRSEKQGVLVGQAMLDWAGKDGYTEAHSKAYTMPTDQVWDYVATVTGGKVVEPYWGTLRPFTLKSATQCDMKRNIDYSTDSKSTFYLQAKEVETVGDNLTVEQKAIADFWVDTPGLTGAPSGHWMLIATQMVPLLKLGLGRAVEMYAMVGVALADSFIACWQMKYTDPVLRPETFIRAHIRATWKPYIQSPMFPTYPSGHSVASSAAADVLTALFGTVAFTDDSHPRNLPSRSFTSFNAAANEAAISRLYGGIHFRFDIENGLTEGHCIAQNVVAKVKAYTAS